MKRKLYRLGPPALLLVLLAGALTWLLASESGLRFAYARVGAALPGTLEVQQLDGRLMGPLHMRGLHYRDRATDVRIDRLTFDWSPFALLAARLHIQQLSAHGVRLRFDTSNDTTSGTTPSLPLAVRIEQLDVSDIHLQRTGQAPYEIESLVLDARIDKDVLQIDRFDVRAPEFQVSARGALDLKNGTERLSMEWRAAPPGLAAFAGEGEITGNVSDLTVNQRLTAPIAAALRAKIKNAPTKLQWHAELDIPAEHLAKLKPGWDGTVGVQLTASGDRTRFQGQGRLRARYPAVAEVTGSFRTHGTIGGQIELDELMLAAAGTDAKLIANAKYHAARSAIDARVRWTDLQWPLAGPPTAMSPAGELKIDGALASYRMTLATQTLGPALPPAEWNIAGRGDRTRFAFETISIKTLGGSLAGNGHVAWSPQFAWDARLEGKGLNPGIRWREWPGAIAFAARAAGSADNMNADVSELGGQLRGQPLHATARVVRQGAHYPVIAAAIQSGRASLNVDGGLQTQWNLSWQVQAPDLTLLWPRAAGRIEGAGRISGRRATPTVQGRLNAAGFSYEQIQIGKLDANANVDFSDTGGSHIDVTLSQAIFDAYNFERIAFRAAGRLASHGVTLDVSAPDAATQMRLNGSYRDASWRGGFTDGMVRFAGQNWTLANKPAALVSLKQMKLEDACWAAAPARVCMEFDWNAGGKTGVALVAERTPLAVFALLLPQPVELHGSFDANVRASVDAGRITSADARFETANGSARLATSETGATFSYRRIHAQLRVDAAGLSSNAELTLASGDGATANVSLPQFAKTSADQAIEGQLKLSFRELTPFAALLPDIRNLKGSLNADLSLRGTLADPVVRGQAQLTDVNARIAATGILVRDARLIARSDGRREIQLNGFARSGNGEIGLSGRLNLEKGLAWRAEFRVAGSDFQAVDLPEANVEVTPDVRVRLAPGEINVEGSLLIPRGRITVRRREGNITPSPDVVVIGESETATKSSPWELTARIQATLGDAVAFEGFGLTGNITGSLTLVDAPDQVTTARGELRIANGKYEAYGQELEIERGRLMYVGGPVDDPGIDVRAVRHIDQIVAGVEVRGTLKSAELRLFSDPPMSDSDALSYLLFGKPVESANAAQGATLAAAARALKLAGGERLAQRLGQRFGIEEVEIEKSPASDQAALVLGKHLSPRLYINYSIGLFESVNVFRIRYQLAAHWILQAETGVNKGGDLLYTIER